jgi:anti-sigma factor ChrR (cupin superfamily)
MSLDQTAAAGPITAPLEQQRWFPLDPGNPGGVQLATLWGDPLRGPFGALLKMPAGFVSPMHRHSNDERVVVLQGASVHWTKGGSRETAPRMTTGDALLMPAGVDHVSAATDEEDCLELITMEGRFDFELSEDP